MTLALVFIAVIECLRLCLGIVSTLALCYTMLTISKSYHGNKLPRHKYS